jgi:hypothetical protein
MSSVVVVEHGILVHATAVKQHKQQKTQRRRHHPSWSIAAAGRWLEGRASVNRKNNGPRTVFLPQIQTLLCRPVVGNNE